MINQSAFMIMATIDSGREGELRQLLAGMNQVPGLADPRNELIPFYQFSNLHFARFTILEANTNEDIRDYGVEPRPWNTPPADSQSTSMVRGKGFSPNW